MPSPVHSATPRFASTCSLPRRAFLVGAACLCVSACQRVLRPFAGVEETSALPENGEHVLMRVATCWSAQPLAEELAADYGVDHEHVAIEIISGNSQLALSLVESGQVALAILGVEQLGAGAPDVGGEQGVRSQVPLALDAVALIVHRDNPVRELSMRELSNLFAGRRLDWSEVSTGAGGVELVSREDGSVTRRVFERVAMGGQQITTSAIVMPHDRAVVRYVSAHVGALGYASLACVDEGVRAIAVDGKLPSGLGGKRATYPFMYPLVALVPTIKSDEVSQFMAYATSPRADRVIERRYALSR